MHKQDLKQKIVDSFKAETPNIESRIISSCETEEQEASDTEAPHPCLSRKCFLFTAPFKKLSVLAACLVLFISGFAIGLFIPQNNIKPVAMSNAETFVYLDVNPSIELQLDSENKVVECLAANDDAQEIVSDLVLQGVDMNTALSAIVGAMYVNGYLNAESNSILISVDSKDVNKTDALLSSITERINTVFENSDLECSIIAQSLTVDNALKEKAEESGISVGKMHLIDKMVSEFDDFNADDTASLADMSIKELNLIYSSRPDKDDENDPFKNDVSSGNIGGFINQGDALALLLEAIETDFSNVEWYQLKVKPNHHGESRQMVYNVLIRFTFDPSICEFEIDCQTGEVTQIDHNTPELDTHPDDNAQNDLFIDEESEGNTPHAPDSDNSHSQNESQHDTPNEDQSNGAASDDKESESTHSTENNEHQNGQAGDNPQEPEPPNTHKTDASDY